MLYASDNEQAAFHSGRQKDLKLTFSDGTVITNDDISLENVSFEQSIMEGDQFEYGHVSSSCFKVRVLGVVQRFKGLNVHAEITAYGEDEYGVTQSYTRSIGYFTVVSDKATSDRLYRDLECYDKLYEILSTDYSTWYNSLKFPMTLKAYRNAFFNHVGIAQENISLINDNMTIERNFVAENYSGSDLLRHICEINGVCGHINYEGKFRYVVFRIVLDGLFPRDDLYPSNTIYPRDPEYFWLRSDEYIQGSLTYEEYECRQVTQLQIRMSEGDVGVVTGSNGNTYIIQNNPLIYGMNDANLRRVANNALAYIRILHYTPCSMKCPANLWYELGDVVGVTTDKDAALLCIGTRRLTGITALFDEYSCEGEEYYSEKANSTNYNIQVLRQKSNELVRNVEETRSTITEVSANLDSSVSELKSSIVQTASQIQTTVSRTQKEWDLAGIPYSISVTGYSVPNNDNPKASSYTGKYYLNRTTGKVYYSNGSTWSERTVATVSLYGYTDPTNAGYAANKNSGKYYLNQTNGYLYYSNGSSWSEARRNSPIQTTMQSQITQTANQISLKVSKGDVIGQINVEVNDKNNTSCIQLKSNKFEVDTEYFKVRKEDGWLTTTGATIGGYTISTNSLYTGDATTDSKDGNVALTTFDGKFTRSINDTSRANLQFAIGTKFAVDYTGALYASGANINGALVNNSGNDEVAIKEGKITITLNDDHSVIYIKDSDGNMVSFGANSAYWTDTDKVFVNTDWVDIIQAGYHYAHGDDSKRLATRSWCRENFIKI